MSGSAQNLAIATQLVQEAMLGVKSQGGGMGHQGGGGGYGGKLHHSMSYLHQHITLKTDFMLSWSSMCI
jgi:hypothetical protein